MANSKQISGFSKLSKPEKIKQVTSFFQNPEEVEKDFISYWHPDTNRQKVFDEFSENTLTNFYFPYGVVPGVVLNGKEYIIPMVIEESSVVAAASKSAKFWSTRGGFHAEVLSTVKIGQVHFIWHGDGDKLRSIMPELKSELIQQTKHITSNMEKRGGGILDIELVDMTDLEDGYYQLKATFDTCDSMGANFINSCLEDFAQILKNYLEDSELFSGKEKYVHIIMSILSNYTPECLVKVWVECPISELGTFDNNIGSDEFAWKFSKALKVAQVDTYRATTHNKGIYNGIDAVVLATGNDFRAIEACGHTYASRNGKYSSLSELELENGIFKFSLTVPMAMGVVGGLTALHPLAKRSIELLGNPDAKELMMIAACMGLANNFGALKSLTTSGIQKGHMKMHLLNILNHFESTQKEKDAAVEYFKTNKVSFNAVRSFLIAYRENILKIESNKASEKPSIK
jgi:hydroxymethylglutaryl-CoA reductase